MLIVDYSTSMNQAFDDEVLRWEAVEVAIADFASDWWVLHFAHVALMRYGHDPSPAVGTLIPGDASLPPLVDGQAIDMPWYDTMSMYKYYYECVGGEIIDALDDNIPPPLGGMEAGIESWTKGALDRTQELILESKLDHPQDLDKRLYTNILITDGAWTDQDGAMSLAPDSENPALSAEQLWLEQGVATHVIYVGAADDIDAKTAVDELALAGGTSTALVAKTQAELNAALETIREGIYAEVLLPTCSPSLPRFMVLLDGSSSMLNINGGTLAGEKGTTGWDHARDGLAGLDPIFSVLINDDQMEAEDMLHLGLAVYGDDSPNPGEQAILSDYGQCQSDNFAWALDPQSSCGEGCDDPWGGPPILWTPVDGSLVDPPGFADPTLSYMPTCDGDQLYCAGSGGFVHLGLGLIRAHQASYHAAALQPDALAPADESTVYANLLVTNGLYAGYSTDAQVQAELEAMYDDGIITYVLGLGDGSESPAAVAALSKMADWGSGGLLDHYDVDSLDDLKGTLKDLLESVAIDPCCTFPNCSLNPEPGIEHECDPNTWSEQCYDEDKSLICVLSPDDQLYHCVESCGNGQVDKDEPCDDGNDNTGDGCQPDCTLSVCGDGHVWVGVEECDDGVLSNSGPCTELCEEAVCGDGHLWKGVEECDDGNTIDGDECSSECLLEKPIYCGDGVLDGGEACDDGNQIDDDACSNTCTQNPFCGDGVLDPGEACDDGNTVDDDECSNTCALVSRCGDGVVDPGEACDDGNTDDGDGCSRACTLEGRCGDGVVDPGEACDDGDQTDDNDCTNACTLPRCGDAIVQEDELCDDGNDLDDDACRNDCSLPTPDVGETCECSVEESDEDRRRALFGLFLGLAVVARRRR